MGDLEFYIFEDELWCMFPNVYIIIEKYPR